MISLDVGRASRGHLVVVDLVSTGDSLYGGGELPVFSGPT